MIIEKGWKLILKIGNENKFKENQQLIALFNLNENPSENENENLINVSAYKLKVDELLKLYNETRLSKVATGIK